MVTKAMVMKKNKTSDLYKSYSKRYYALFVEKLPKKLLLSDDLLSMIAKIKESDDYDRISKNLSIDYVTSIGLDSSGSTFINSLQSDIICKVLNKYHLDFYKKVNKYNNPGSFYGWKL